MYTVAYRGAIRTEYTRRARLEETSVTAKLIFEGSETQDRREGNTYASYSGTYSVLEAC